VIGCPLCNDTEFVDGNVCPMCTGEHCLETTFRLVLLLLLLVYVGAELVWLLA
jgi:hypothetical protein